MKTIDETTLEIINSILYVSEEMRSKLEDTITIQTSKLEDNMLRQ